MPQAAKYAFIALGSNLSSGFGTPAETVRFAIHQLAGLSTAPLLISSLYETAPLECPPSSAAFANAVVGLQPKAGESPESLLAKLQSLEADCGRERSSEKNAPRTLDLDLITFKDHRCDSPALTLPHPEAHKRRFVLQPLHEIAGDWTLPGHSMSVAAMLARASHQIVKII